MDQNRNGLIIEEEVLHIHISDEVTDIKSGGAIITLN